MPTYRTPGTYIDEGSGFAPAVVPVATAIPAFIGYTGKATGPQGKDLTETAVRIASWLEYETHFGNAPAHEVAIEVVKRIDENGRVLRVDVDWTHQPSRPKWFLPYSLQLYFANGGGPCYVYSTGDHGAAPSATDFTKAIAALEAIDEVTLLLFPDSTLLDDDDHGLVIDAALVSCNKKQNRFVIADVRNAVEGGTDTHTDVSSNFRSKIGRDAAGLTQHGAAYFPYLVTDLPFFTNDASVTLTSYSSVKVRSDGAEDAPNEVATDKKLDDAALDLKAREVAVYAAVRFFLNRSRVVVPPSGAVAGVYVDVDQTRGVWKAPANVGLRHVVAPAVGVSNDVQDELNIDASTGKSVNVIRAFPGKGTLVWGSRTLAGNDNEWRYVNVRRFANFVGESIRKAIGAFALERNDADTWVRARATIGNFLIGQWRNGALMGARPEQAFGVAIGLGQTMRTQDLLDGRMIVEVRLAIVRPAEFIVLRLMQKMPQG